MVDFIAAEAGASVALAGLIFVGLSLNLDSILASPGLSRRALEALFIQLAVWVVSSLLLIPDQNPALAGAVVDIRIWRDTEIRYRRGYALPIVMNQFAVVPYIIAGVVPMNAGGSGVLAPESGSGRNRRAAAGTHHAPLEPSVFSR